MAAVQDSMSRFILKWAGANTVGWLAAAVLALPFLLLYQPLHKGIAGAAIGIGLGAGQWLLMRHYLEKAGWWIVVTVVGFAVGGALMGFGTTEELSKRGLSTETVGFVLGATAGVAQWTVLRWRSPRAIWWIPASIGAFGLGWFVNWSVDFGFAYEDPLGLVVSFPLLLIPFVLISGATLRWIVTVHSATPVESSTH